MRGRLALPFTVLFSLPRDAVNALNGESIGVGWGGGDKRTGPKESYLGASKGVCWKECAGIDGDGKVADVACLRVEVRYYVMISSIQYAAESDCNSFFTTRCTNMDTCCIFIYSFFSCPIVVAYFDWFRISSRATSHLMNPGCLGIKNK